VDAAFPLSDHADFPSLLRYAKATGASRVFTMHGHAAELARSLRREDIRAEPLEESPQMELW
jgi:putative mRNA 3-end processing factor